MHNASRDKQHGQDRTRELLQQRRALADFGMLALQEVDLDRLLTEAARLCAEGLNVPYCKILEFRETERDLIVRAGVGWKPDVVGQALARADETNPGGKAYATREPVIIKDVNSPGEFELPGIYPQHGIVSSVNVVIAGHTDVQPYGVLECDSPERREFDEHDVSFLQGYANIVAEAIGRLRRQETERGRAQETVTLLRELQHRVRNNLHALHSLAYWHSRATNVEDAKSGIADLSRRVMTLASLYDHLLGQGLAGTTDLGAYLTALCRDIAAFQELKTQTVELTCETVNVQVSLNVAMSLGIVVNELVSNAYEHAFPERGGTIAVTLERPGDGRARLTISDNGTGLPTPPRSGSTGLGLVHHLVTTIGATIEGRAEAGTTWTIWLPVDTEAR